MNLSKLDLNLFLVFEAIFQTGSLTTAAKELHLSQPAVSHALARLRDALQDPLFVRQGRRMLPTPYARALAPSVRQALGTLQNALKDPGTTFVPADSDRVFTIGMRDILESLTLPGLMAHIRQHAPGISVVSVQIDRHDIADALRQGRVDAVVDVALPVAAEVMHMRLLLDRLVVVAQNAHPAIGDGTLSLDGYLAASHVLVSGRRQGLGLEDYELSRQGLRRHIGLRCRHYVAACSVVSMTDMLLTMPEQYARVANAPYGNVLHPFPLSPAQMDVHMYWHAAADADPTNLWLRRRMVEALAHSVGLLAPEWPADA
jgi:DNA-binding transcriptional LysR family regulator